MVKRKRIALIYTYNENWIGGTYYIENLIAALNQLPDNEQPYLVIFSKEATDADKLQQSLKYPYWSFRRLERTLSIPERLINKLTSLLLNKRFIGTLYKDIDLIFPLPTTLRHYFQRVPQHLYWIPDFQEHYLPHFFNSEEIHSRKADQKFIVDTAKHIVFSSYSAQYDFNSIYPKNNIKQYVLQFAVSNYISSNNIEKCLAKYNIVGPYFLCCNQMWKHKDHPTLLRAISQISNAYPNLTVLFTGKESDYRNPDYFEELISLQKDLNIIDKIKFLGFIPREDQLLLMQNTLAVVQPSLFEGWSTVVEDAKSLNINLIVSNLNVHREQLSDYDTKLFFSVGDDKGLANAMEIVLKGNLPKCDYSYTHDVLRFGKEFMNIVNIIIG